MASEPPEPPQVMQAWNELHFEAISVPRYLNWTTDIIISMEKLALTPVFRGNIKLFDAAIRYAIFAQLGRQPFMTLGVILPQGLSPHLDELEKEFLASEKRKGGCEIFVGEIPPAAILPGSFIDIPSKEYFPKVGEAKYEAYDFMLNPPKLLTLKHFKVIEAAYEKYAARKGLPSLDTLCQNSGYDRVLASREYRTRTLPAAGGGNSGGGGGGGYGGGGGGGGYGGGAGGDRMSNLGAGLQTQKWGE